MFSEKTLEFLEQNRLINSKEWFYENKQVYNDNVLSPLVSLANELAPAINSIDEWIITEAKTDKTISRIYCDMRFSKERLLFREQMWISFRRDRHSFPHYPEFFFIISPDESFFGCGYYSAGAAAMQAVRDMVLSADPLFVKADKAFRSGCFIMEGDCYKKSRYPQCTDAQREWLDRKSICLMYYLNKEELFSDKLGEKIKSAFLSAAPVYNLFLEAEKRAAEI